MATYLGRFAVLTALAHFALELCINFLPVVYPTLITSMGLTYAQIGFIALVASLCGSLTQPLFGYLSDRWGPNRIVIMSIAWSGLIMGLVGFTGTYAVLILLVGLGALGSAAFHPAGAVLASVTASKRRGTAISVFSVGGNLGAALSPLWVAAGISWLGLGGTIVITPIALIVTFALYRHLKQHTGLVDDRLKANREQARPQARTNNTPLITGLALIILVVMSRTWFQVSLMTYLPEWIRSQGQSLTFGGQVLAVFMFAISVGSLTGGSLSDYLGRWQVVASSLAILGLGQWLFINTSLVWQQVLLSGLMGLMIGASFPVAIVMAQETWPHGVGVASALVMGLGWAPGGLGAWVTGLIADQSSLTFGLQSLIFLPLLGAVGALAYALLPHGQAVDAPTN